MKFCSQCGMQLNDDARFCPSCGTQQEIQQSPQFQVHQSEQPQNHQLEQQQMYQTEPQQSQPYYQQPIQQQNRQRRVKHQRPVKVEKGPNPVEQAVVNFADRYCGYNTLGWALGLCILCLVLLIFYNGPLLNFSGVLEDISYKIIDFIPIWVVPVILQISLLYMFMHLVNALYKAGATWPLLYITPCVWVISLILYSVICITQNISYDDLNNIQSLVLASYVCVGIIGILCAKIEAFSWTGKVLIIAAICWIVFELSSNMIPLIFLVLSSVWYIFEINSRVRHFFNDYYYEDEEEYYDENSVYQE